MSESVQKPSPAHLIELRLWRQFVAVAEELHFGHAALRLHMTQPPLTQAIAQLEKLMGVRLFDRTKRSVALTLAGAALLPQARDLLARAQALPAQARAAAGGEVGRLRLAFVSTVGDDTCNGYALSRALSGRATGADQATGDVQLQLLSAARSTRLHAVGSSLRADAPAHRQEPLVVAMPEAHPLSATARSRWKEVLASP
jgi:DNA-binding transcriptional LysR family regulator